MYDHVMSLAHFSISDKQQQVQYNQGNAKCCCRKKEKMLSVAIQFALSVGLGKYEPVVFVVCSLNSHTSQENKV